MNVKDVGELITIAPEYEFLKTHPDLGSNIILLGVGGSYAYGTNVEGSDIDIRGVTMNSKESLLSNQNFEQVIDESTDTTIYALNKFISLATNCNPNVIELLGLKDDYFSLNDIGQQLLDNKKLFLSQRAIHSFGGFANSQLRRLQNFVASQDYPQAEKEQHILGSIKHSMGLICEKYAAYDDDAFKVYVDKAVTPELDDEVFLDVNLKHYPLRDFKDILSSMTAVVTGYEQLGKRNTKKTEIKICKHAMHLVRIYLMGLDILEKGEVITHRENELELLMQIRNGHFQDNSGKFRSEFFELVTDYEKRFEYACEHTNLPKKPPVKEIQTLQMTLNEEWIRKS